MKVAHVSTFPQMRCGIAIYAADLIAHLSTHVNVKCTLHYGNNPTPDSDCEANVTEPVELCRLARFISQSDCDVVHVQHEFGIWGGEEGEYIKEFLKYINKPIVCTLHTTFGIDSANPSRHASLSELIRRSIRVIVLTRASKKALCEALGHSGENVVVLPHGVPEVPFMVTQHGPEGTKAATQLRFISIGFFRPDKGLEEVLLALWTLKRLGIPFSYVIAGQPQQQFGVQNKYYEEILDLVEALQLAKHVRFNSCFLTREEQIIEIQRCHAAIFAYQEDRQSSSGTMPLVLSSGRPVICTPFEYALSIHEKIPGIFIAKGFSAGAIAEEILIFLNSFHSFELLCRSVYEETRSWTWKNVAACYAEQFDQAVRA